MRVKVEKEYLNPVVKSFLSYYKDVPAVHTLCFVLDILRDYIDHSPELVVLAWNQNSILVSIRIYDRQILVKVLVGAVEILSVWDGRKKPLRIHVYDDSDTFEYLRALIETAF
ncbi:hypothetical protein BCF55_0993 [Hydrogenivirga caldilitoris]|uniref:Uncharacterized protein n=1 Tax=Hydrogenivirga caldilitoris TaxID=246264 RepID=A0A497XU93_9AQUI|nr:hypothetical protein [Hydrogenivirga caldilitoris]RLJ70712.1 hypothetical protein BCF55_0993 [Hydrogenivirga caldilitoris]